MEKGLQKTSSQSSLMILFSLSILNPHTCSSVLNSIEKTKVIYQNPPISKEEVKLPKKSAKFGKK
jgi:hypothetical protein